MPVGAHRGVNDASRCVEHQSHVGTVGIARKKQVAGNGNRCRRVQVGRYQEDYRNLALWVALCDDGRYWGVFIAPNGDTQVRECTEMRQLQYAEDEKRGEGKRSRTGLAPAYVERYTAEVLDRVDLAPIVRWIGNSKPALLCVERDPEACHRSLVAERLGREFGFEVEHLRPQG